MDARALILITAVILTITTGAANADLVVRFEEAAPKGRFFVTNSAACTYERGVLVIDLAPSPRGLLFDTARGGGGENVAQPIDVAVAENLDVVTASVADGARSAKVAFNRFPSNGRLVINVDVDDSERSGPMGVQMISASEMGGARIRVVLQDGATRDAVFNAQGEARITETRCRFG